MGVDGQEIEQKEASELPKQLAEVLAMGEMTYGMQAVLRLLEEEISLRKGFEESKRTVQEKLRNLDLTRVQFGGGRHVLEGWTNIDIIEPADLVWDVREKLPLPDACSEKVFSEHMMEHLPYPRAKLWVAECCRILKPEGKMILGVPDAGMAMRAYSEDDEVYFRELRERWYAKRTNMEDYSTPIDMVGLVMLDQENDPKYHRHNWGYDETNLTGILKEAGFSEVKKWDFDPGLANQRREWGSVYLEAIK